MFINRKTGEIAFKIVYYGPPFSGKTTNLEYIHHQTPKTLCGEMVSLKTRGDRTLFFDFMQLELPTVQGLTPKFNLYTVPGQIAYAGTRKLVLQGADGVIFVADSRRDRLQDNLYSLVDLYKNLKAAGTNPQEVSIIVQFNKRDLKNVSSINDIRKALRLDGYKISSFEAIAFQGIGVLSTLKASINAVTHRMRSVSN